jgi:hypothetical protein
MGFVFIWFFLYLWSFQALIFLSSKIYKKIRDQKEDPFWKFSLLIVGMKENWTEGDLNDDFFGLTLYLLSSIFCFGISWFTILIILFLKFTRLRFFLFYFIFLIFLFF